MHFPSHLFIDWLIVGNGISETLNFKIFWGSMPPHPLTLERLRRSKHSSCAYTFKISHYPPAVGDQFWISSRQHSNFGRIGDQWVVISDNITECWLAETEGIFLNHEDTFNNQGSMITISWFVNSCFISRAREVTRESSSRLNYSFVHI